MGMLGVHEGVNTGPGLTKQAFADETNINKIVAGFEKTGMINHLSKAEPFYGDVSGLVDYQESLNVVMRAEELFNSMSADIRSRFQNDPAEMIEFLNDPANQDEAIKLGMLVPRVEPEPQKVVVVSKNEPGEPVVDKSKKT